VIVTDVFVATADVVMVKLAELWPAGTVTIGGTCAADELLVDSVTDAPPDGAALLNDTVPEMLVPPVALFVPVVNVLSWAAPPFGSGKIVIHSPLVTDPDCAVISAECMLLTCDVVTVKVAVVLPAAICTVGGTCAAGSLLARKTVVPPAGAGVASSTVPCSVPPATVDTGWTDIAERSGTDGCDGSIRSTAPCMPDKELPYDAWIITQYVEVTCGAVIVKLALVLPAGTVTPPDGVTTCPSMLPFTHTDAPPAGAGAVSVIVPVVV